MEIIHPKDLATLLQKKAINAKKRIYICSPYIGGKASVLNLIGNKWELEENIKMRFIIDASSKGNYDYDTLKYLLSNSKVKAKSLTALHAKIYIIDDECLVTSANLTYTAFACRYEIGIHLSKQESKPIFDYFDELWGKSKNITIKDLGRRSGNKYNKEEKLNRGFSKLWDIPKTGTQAWLKINGTTNSRIDENEVFNGYENYGNTSFGVKPTIKPNELVILSHLGERIIKGKKIHDTCIYGRATVETGYRKDVDDVLLYIRKKHTLNDESWENLNRWRYGIWFKNIEVIKGKAKTGIWLKDLKNDKGEPLIKPTSISEHSHIKLNPKIFTQINNKLNKHFKENGSYTDNNPKESWWNDNIKSKKYNITKVMLNDKYESLK
ncbi:MAG: phospholipase D family protein [Ignavibacteria bacterium]